MKNRILGIGDGCVTEKVKGHTHLWIRKGDMKFLGFWKWLVGSHYYECSKCKKIIGK